MVKTTALISALPLRNPLAAQMANPVPCFLGKSKENHPKMQDFFLSAEPLKSLETRETNQIQNRKVYVPHFLGKDKKGTHINFFG